MDNVTPIFVNWDQYSLNDCRTRFEFPAISSISFFFVRKKMFSQLMRKVNLEVTEKRVENYIFRIRRERLKGCLSRELHFSYESRKSQRGLKSRITFLLSGRLLPRNA